MKKNGQLITAAIFLGIFLFAPLSHAGHRSHHGWEKFFAGFATGVFSQAWLHPVPAPVHAAPVYVTPPPPPPVYVYTPPPLPPPVVYYPPAPRRVQRKTVHHHHHHYHGKKHHKRRHYKKHHHHGHRPHFAKHGGMVNGITATVNDHPFIVYAKRLVVQSSGRCEGWLLGRLDTALDSVPPP